MGFVLATSRGAIPYCISLWLRLLSACSGGRHSAVRGAAASGCRDDSRYDSRYGEALGGHPFRIEECGRAFICTVSHFPTIRYRISGNLQTETSQIAAASILKPPSHHLDPMASSDAKHGSAAKAAMPDARLAELLQACPH